jgi:hypothetical protein
MVIYVNPPPNHPAAAEFEIPASILAYRASGRPRVPVTVGFSSSRGSGTIMAGSVNAQLRPPDEAAGPNGVYASQCASRPLDARECLGYRGVRSSQ